MAPAKFDVNQLFDRRAAAATVCAGFARQSDLLDCASAFPDGSDDDRVGDALALAYDHFSDYTAF